MRETNNKIGVLVVNLGTPSEPTTGAVYRYLSQFLSDQRVIDLPRLLWSPLLHTVILPIRSPKVAKLYQSIWMPGGSPLRVYNQSICDKLTPLLNEHQDQEVVVLSAMSYGEPSMSDALAQLEEMNVGRIIVMPLYPQYSATTTAVVYDQLAAEMMYRRWIPEVRMVMDYHVEPAYIEALAKSVRAHWQQHGQSKCLLMSFHGMPQRYVDAGDPYQMHCEKTARALATTLGLSDDQWQLSYQSRFGKAEWLKPYTDGVLEGMPGKGIDSVDVICPAFSVDCLETLEEIAEENKEVFIEAGGKEYRYIAALNDNEDQIALLSGLINREVAGWRQ